MSLLTTAFNSENYSFKKDNDYVLSVKFTCYNGSYSAIIAYDFLGRVAVTRAYSDGGVSLTPFAQLDQESLSFFREKLIELGGHPPELASSTPLMAPNPSQKGKLTL